MNNKKKLNEFLTAMGEIYKREISEVLFKIYWESLKKYSDEELDIAFSKVLTECEFFPVPAVIIKRIPRKEMEEEQISAIGCWGDVLSGLSCGRIPIDPDIQNAIHCIGGWEWLQTKTYDELHWIEKRFNEYMEHVIDRNKYLTEGRREQTLLQ
uniref:Uncharacterized protein n=1 Tax=viral metagenome TaxID=1070528 RepID=A0A6H1ZD58_9ZZZZ